MFISNLIIAGNIGADPEMRYTPAGTAVTSFRVAVNRQYKDKSGQTVKETAWFKVSSWDKLAETCNQYLKKGAKVLVEGRLEYDKASGGPRTWIGQDGATHTSFDLTAQTVRFLSPKDGAAPAEVAASAEVPASDDDIPF